MSSFTQGATLNYLTCNAYGHVFASVDIDRLDVAERFMIPVVVVVIYPLSDGILEFSR